jgi:hypothetical protein
MEIGSDEVAGWKQNVIESPESDRQTHHGHINTERIGVGTALKKESTDEAESTRLRFSRQRLFVKPRARY